MSYYNLKDEVNKLQEQTDKLEKLVYKITNNTTSGGALLEGVNSNRFKDKGEHLVPYFQSEIDWRKERIQYIKSKLKGVDELLSDV